MNRLIIFKAILFGSAVFISAQQTIFNVPTTDVLDRGKVYMEIDAAFKLDRTDEFGRFSSFVPRIVVGVGGNVEVGLNVTGNVQPGADSTTLVPTVKWKFYESKTKDTALIAGTNFYIPVRNRSYNVGAYTYLAVSRTINKTRLTAGGYVASKNLFASKAVRAGGHFGVEQTINSKVTLAADWITGRHSAGYLTPGVIYKPHPKVTAYFSYSIGNDRAVEGNNFFLFELGYNFN
ncbi:MAG: hypothetical protein IPK01_15045 [Acidobacteria bacterium]|nr:hypothetical protein [Acidobacteriota bacterium]